MHPIFTVGHSTKSVTEFVGLLRCGWVELVVDVRTVPRSRHNPQYNEDVLGTELATYQIDYHRMAPLGGLRGRSPHVLPEVNALWENQSLPQLRGLCLVRSVRCRSQRTDAGKLQPRLRHHVCRSCLVEVPPTNYRGLSDHAWSRSVSPNGE
jgi:hypothetical protein